MSTTTPLRERPYRVIFADDDADTLAMLEMMGRRKGWHVDTATSAEELLAKVEIAFAPKIGRTVDGYDIVVTDVSFFNGATPGISGIAAARQLERAYPNLPILFLSGYGGLLTRENVRSLKSASYPENYMEKPVDPDNLIERIDYLIRFTASRYEGVERRRTSINRSGLHRRSTDVNLGVPRILRLVMNQKGA